MTTLCLILRMLSGLIDILACSGYDEDGELDNDISIKKAGLEDFFDKDFTDILPIWT